MASPATIAPANLAAAIASSIPYIDLATLSSGELRALSLLSVPSSAAASSPLAAPKIDRSQFNESAGSHRQTFSSSAAIAGHAHPRRRVAALPKPPSPSDPGLNRLIIDRLKLLLSGDRSFDSIRLCPPLAPPPERKRKRGRKPKAVAGTGLNRDGVAVDAAAVAEMEDPFGAELRRRTEGLESEEGLLGFMRGVEGQWGSRRKRRRIVDAAEFGDALPIGWKLLLGIKRKEGHAWIYCRRYISPSGEQFLSCKEVSMYLTSVNILDSTQQSNYGQTQMLEGLQASRPKTIINAGLIFKESNRRQSINEISAISTHVYNDIEKENVLLGIENLAEVQIQDLFECHKCDVTFDGKDSYLKHLFAVHEKITRRYRLGSSVGEGVIIKDGKYECQFCHKVFLERRSYNGHVGIHVRNYVRSVDEETEHPSGEEPCSRNSRMEALVEIAQNSMLEASNGSNNESHAILEDHVIIDGSGEKTAVSVSEDNSLSVKEHDLATAQLIGQTVCDAEGRIKSTTCSLEDSKFVEGDDESRELNMQIDATETQYREKPLLCFPMVVEASDKRDENLTGFEETEPFKYDFGVVEECGDLQDVPVEVANSSEIECMFDSSSPVQFESDLVHNFDPLTTSCVWCGVEFNHNDADDDSEVRSDSVGFMCPTCKSKVTTEHNMLDNGSPVDPLLL